jgi:hypothetical protein
MSVLSKGQWKGVEQSTVANIEHGHILFVRVLCGVVCGTGDVKYLEDSIHNTSNVCGRASVEEEVIIPGHYGILKGDGELINRIMLEVCEKNVDACGARCQGCTNIFSGSGIFISI